MKKGFVHIYTGDGKGKTTSAAGLASRAAGAGLKVLFLQLFKSGICNEYNTLKDCVTFKRCELDKFTWNMSQDEINDYGKRAVKAAEEAICSESYDVVVIDEIFMLTKLGLISVDYLSALIDKRRCELVLTGRNAPMEIINIADYVSEIKCVKHPYNCGVKFRKGIEF